MQVTILTLEDWSDAEESLAQINSITSSMSMESYSTEGFKETIRHYWQLFIEWIKKLWAWAKGHFTNLKGKMNRTRERLEACMSRAELCRSQKLELGGTEVPLNANQFRALIHTLETKVSSNLLGDTATTMVATSKDVYDYQPAYIKQLIDILNKGFGTFDVLNADVCYKDLITNLNQIKFGSGFAVGQFVKMPGLKQLGMTPYKGLDIGYLSIGTARAIVREPTSPFKSPSTTDLSDRILVSYRNMLNKAIKYVDESLPDLQAEEKKLSRIGEALIQRINQETEGNSNEEHISKMIHQMLSTEQEIAKSINPIIVEYTTWVCDTIDVVCDVVGKILDTKLKTENKDSEPASPTENHTHPSQQSHGHPQLPK